MMTETGKRAQSATISELGIINSIVHWNLSSEELSQISIDKNQATLTSSSAITVNTGEFTGRSPKDRFIVRDSITENSVWWGDVNLSFDSDKFDSLHQKVINYLSGKAISLTKAWYFSGLFKVIFPTPSINSYFIIFFRKFYLLK